MRAAVVGAGITGLATALALLERGADVTVYERGVPGSAQSGGESRIFRHAHDDPRLVALAIEARAAWREWEARFGVELVSRDGAILLGPAVERRGALLRDAGLAVREVDGHPLMGPRDRALLDEDGGVIRTRAAVGALVAALGDRIVADEVLAAGADGVVRAGGGAARYDRVIVCAGRDTSTLAGGLPVALSTHVRLTFPLRGPAPDRLPCLQDTVHGAYGDPLPGNDRFAVGLADDPQETIAYVARELPGLEPEPVEERHCWVTELPSGPDAMAVWERDRALLVAGNNMFKHAPVLGRALAAAALGDGVRDELRL
jgi:glycine/D-amino acid oxidase-like deaminating enzyme